MATKEERLFASFSLCETTCCQLQAMRPKMRLRFYDALIDFGIYGIEPDFEGVDEVIWIPMRDFILNSKQEDELWRQRKCERGKLGGAPKGNHNARKQPKTENSSPPPDEQTTKNNQNNQDNAKQLKQSKQSKQSKQPIREEKGIEETITKEKRREESGELDSKQVVDSAFSLPEFDSGNSVSSLSELDSVDSGFSLSQELHPAQTDLITRILAHENTWNKSGVSPPCKLIMFSPLQFQDMTPTLVSYSDEKIDKAIRNYAEVLKSGNLGREPCSSFVNFIIRWVEKFVDEAKPFARPAAGGWGALPNRGARKVLATHGESL
jgi:hypothetical protein